MEKENILVMRDIVKEFPGVRALDHAKLILRKGTVHALMGENGAGKSTLMKCLFGIYKEDEGSIEIEGVETHFSNPKQALENGVAMVHQELNQVLRRNVMENIWLGRFPAKYGFVNHKEMYRKTKEVFDDLGIDVDPRTMVHTLSVSERQMIEIAKAASYNAKIVVLDEPTSSLANEEVEKLFAIIEKLKAKDVAIIYISHKMDEILRISDEVTIMRDGKWISTLDAKELTTDRIIQLMIGRELENRFPPKTNRPGDVIMSVRNLTGEYGPTCEDVTFDLHKGEVLGLAGLVGSRRTELLETIFGYRKKRSGDTVIHGKSVQITSPSKAIKNRLALLTEERRVTGIIPLATIAFNSVMVKWNDHKKMGFINNAMVRKSTQWVIDNMHVKTPSQRTHIKSLSGGNQQKVILGRWLLTDPDILLLDEPTRGIDVGAKYEIYQLIDSLAAKGNGVLVVSSEMPELIGICDRILVMSNGRLAGEVNLHEEHEDIQNEIMTLATKYL